jgi:hypothetical protein
MKVTGAIMKDESSVQYQIYRKHPDYHEQFCYLESDDESDDCSYNWASWGVDPTMFDTLDEVYEVISRSKDTQGVEYQYYICTLTITHQYEEV